MTNIIEECRISPASGAVVEHSLPLTFSDLLWIHAHVVQTLFFYESPHSKTHFIDTTIPALKHSLSLALKHFHIFAGNLLFPLNHKDPELRYEDGDSISLTFVESDGDFHSLIKDHPRELSHFHPLIPHLPPVSEQDGFRVAPLLAAQVTVFPNSGISFGFTVAHVVSDASTFNRFMKLWGTIHRAQAEPTVLDSALFPAYDRSIVVEKTQTLVSLTWQHQKRIKFEGSRPLRPSSNVLGTFVLREADLLRLKKRVKAQHPTLPHVSSFTVTCALTWACFVKSRAACSVEMSDNEVEWLGFTAECRSYFDPPLPDNYFGNCILPCVAAAKRGELINENGFMHAACLIGEAIRETLRSGKGVLEGAEKMFPDGSSASMNRERVMGVSGSPKFAVYDIDFGLGKLQKREYVSIDATRAISLLRGRENERDVEIGLTLPKIRMDAFTSLFWNGLTD